MSIDFDLSFVKFNDHIDFVKLIMDGQREANRTNRRVEIDWRGSKSWVVPNLPEIGTSDLKLRLYYALKGVTDLTKAEYEVIYKCFN